IADLTITGGKLANGSVVRSLNGLTDLVTLLAGSNVTITPSGNTLTVAASSSPDWKLSGNSGTIAGTQFLGTTDDEPLELKVNNLRALRLEPGSAPNLIGGSPVNAVAFNIIGATISGGGITNYFGLPGTNRVAAHFGTIGGGYANTINPLANDSTI